MSRWSPFDPDADRRLVRGLNEGNEDTLIALYDTYAERLYDYCVSLVCDSKVAADTVHDCLIDACRRAPRMRDRMRLRAWLYGAARRRCLQRGRSGGLHWEWAPESARTDARAAVGVGATDGGATDGVAADGGGADGGGADGADRTGESTPGGELPSADGDDSGLSLDERRDLLELTLSRLEFPEQEALLLACRHEVTGGDLAATLGVSRRRAASRLARARAEAEAAMTSELRMLSRQSAKGRKPETALSERARRAEAVKPLRPLKPSEPSEPAGTADPAEADAAETGGKPEAAERPKPLRSRESLKTVIEAAGKPEPAASSTGEGRPGRVAPAGKADQADKVRKSAKSAKFGKAGAVKAGAGVAGTGMARGTGEAAGERHGRIALTDLLDLAQAPAPPAALRRRVVHTATDPELAGYRADIAGRGGNLTTQGLPRQPDVTPPFAKRWMFAAGGMVGALATATVAILIIGPDLPGPQLYWPSRPQHKTPAEPGPTQSIPYRGPALPPTPGGPGAQRPVADAPQLDGKLSPSPPRPRTPIIPPQPGRLVLESTKIGLGPGERETFVDLAASRGAVTWNALASSPQLTLSASGGKIPKGGTTRIHVAFARGLIQLQGKATITLTSDGGRPQTVTVTWAGSILT